MALVGTALMRSDDPTALVMRMRDAGRPHDLREDLRSQHAEHVEAAIDAGADALGFVFAESRRVIAAEAREH